MLRVLFVAVAVLTIGSCKVSGGGSGTDPCGSDVCKITASDAIFTNAFSFAVAIDGDEMLVGAELNDEAGRGAGAVYAYRRVGSEYEEVQKFVPANSTPGDAFGSAIAIDGDVAVIGARLAYGGNGAAYVFRLVAGQWIEEAELIGFFDTMPPFGPPDGQFGRRVAISGDWIAVAAPREDFLFAPFHEKMGSVVMFENVTNPGTWTRGQLILPSSFDPGDQFGTSVAMDGSVMSVGAIGDDDTAADSGAAYVFSLTGTTWSLDQKLKALREPLVCEGAGLRADAYLGDHFGSSMAVLGGRVVVGADSIEFRQQNAACGLRRFEVNNGAAYVYQETAPGSGVWDFEVRLQAADRNSQKSFGRSVSIDTDVIAVGARGDDQNGTFSGAGYIFRFDNMTMEWSQDVKIRAFDGVTNDWYGESIGIDNERVVIGAWGQDDFGPQSGAAYAYDL